MFDIHCHILPGVDDGAKDIDVSKGLIKQEIDNGVKYICLTPHQNSRNLNKEGLIEVFNNLKKEIGDEINLFLGCELYYYDSMIRDLKDGKILTMNNSKYVLVEFSTRLETPISDILYDIKVNGYIPIIAHIERYSYLTLKDYDEISKYALIQVNSKSLSDKYYKKQMKYLFKNKLVSFIASDCHNLDRRCCDFTEAKKIISKKYKDQYDKLFNNLPEFLK